MPVSTLLPSDYTQPGIVQVDKFSGAEPLSRSYRSFAFLENLYRTRRAALTDTDCSSESVIENDLLYMWRTLVDTQRMAANAPNGNIITRLDPSQKVSGSTLVPQFGSKRTWFNFNGSNTLLTNGIGIIPVTLQPCSGGVDTGLTSKFVVIAGFYIPAFDTVTKFELLARAKLGDTESYRLIYQRGGYLKSTSRSASVDTDEAALLADTDIKNKGSDIVIAFRVDSASAGSAYLNGQRVPVAIGAAGQAMANTYAGIRLSPSPNVPQSLCTYFEIVAI